MENIYFTSDLHFGHNRDFIFGPRGFTNVQDHDETIIKNWNALVQPNDTVYILGDIMLNDNVKGVRNFNRLNGTKFIILGNHDTKERKEIYKTQLANTTVIGNAVNPNKVSITKRIFFFKVHLLFPISLANL